MKQLWAVFLIAVVATCSVPAVAKSCKGGKCISPAKLQAMKRQQMKKRLSTPLPQTAATIRLNQQIVLLARTNAGGRNNAQIRNLQQQRNQILKSQRRAQGL